MCNTSMLKPEILYGYLYKPMGTEPKNKNFLIYLICINTYINYLKIHSMIIHFFNQS